MASIFKGLVYKNRNLNWFKYNRNVEGIRLGTIGMSCPAYGPIIGRSLKCDKFPQNFGDRIEFRVSAITRIGHITVSFSIALSLVTITSCGLRFRWSFKNSGPSKQYCSSERATGLRRVCAYSLHIQWFCGSRARQLQPQRGLGENVGELR